MVEIYKPREDSFLLKKHLKKHVKGIVLDTGTGTGIQALEAASSKKVVKVYAVDINSKAIDYCRANINNKKIVFLTSDLFHVFRVDQRYKNIKFDTIIFNPPYLPTEKRQEPPTKIGSMSRQKTTKKVVLDVPEDPSLKKGGFSAPKDISLDGGKKGYELICRFLNEVKPFLKGKTKILLIFSSVTGKEKLEHYLTKNYFKFQELEKQHIFFEDLYVYLIEK